MCPFRPLRGRALYLRPMLKHLHVRNFTVFADAEFAFGPGLNVVVGANGAGKSHVLKLGYAVEAAQEAVAHDKMPPLPPTVSDKYGEDVQAKLGGAIVISLGGTFNIKEDFASVKRKADIPQSAFFEVFSYSKSAGEGSYNVKINSTDSVGVISAESREQKNIFAPVFLPPKEVLSIFPGLGSLARKYKLNFDQTYLDLLDALELPPLRQLSPETEALIKHTLQPILGGELVLEGGRFYVVTDDGKRLEINLAAEGIRKFGMLAQLLNNGSLSAETTLYWDEPEANLNPALLRKLAALLATLARQGFQIILATHSLFLLKELHILARREPTPVRYFGLFAGPAGDTQVETTDDFELLQHLTALDAELEQTVDFEHALATDDADAD